MTGQALSLVNLEGLKNEIFEKVWKGWVWDSNFAHIHQDYELIFIF